MKLRADLKSLGIDDAESLDAALALPMVYRNDVTGFLLLGPKPSGSSYRPDEVRTLTAAVRKIGLDLHTLRIEELEEALSAEKTRTASLDAQLRVILKTMKPVSGKRAPVV